MSPTSVWPTKPNRCSCAASAATCEPTTPMTVWIRKLITNALMAMAFSSEVDLGSRQENASRRATLERPRAHAFGVAFEVLRDEVVTDELLVGVGDALGHRTPHLILRPDRNA